MPFISRTFFVAGLAATLAAGAWAQDKAEPTVVDKVGSAVHRGASAAERGIKTGVGAAASGVKRAASAAERGAKAAGGAIDRTARRIGLPASGASAPASDNR
jgi:hypothetical protein